MLGGNTGGSAAGTMQGWEREEEGNTVSQGDSLNKGKEAAPPSRVWSLGSPLKGRKRECLPVRHHL